MSAQPDLFGDLPTSKAPPKSDTPLLLAMDSDYVTGAQLDELEEPE